MKGTLAVIRNNMSKMEVKYIPGENGKFLSEDRWKKINLSSISLLLSGLSILLSVVLFATLITWMVGISQQIELRDQEVERLEYMLEKRGYKPDQGSDTSSVEDLVEVDPEVIVQNKEFDLPEITARDCLDNPAAGPCRGRESRFYWDNDQGVCLKFSYGGCAGNKNNFISKEECEVTCKSKVRANEEKISTVHQLSRVHQCQLPLEAGPCKGQIDRWHYSNDQGCTQFSWGGCGGNSNNFVSQQKCIAACSQGSQEVVEAVEEVASDHGIRSECMEEKEPGLCFGAFTRFFYNQKTSQCEEFMYGGCGGTKNNFKNKQLCQEECSLSK